MPPDTDASSDGGATYLDDGVERGQDAARLAASYQVIRGEDHAGNGNAVYVGYVAVLGAGAYGVPAAQQFFRFLDPQWMADHLSGVRGLLVGVVAAVALLALAFRVGTVRGPVVPDLPYLDHVATSPLDRAVVLRRWWQIGLTGSIVGGLIVGLVVGAGLAIASVAGPVVLLPSVVVGAVVGLLTAGSWLQGQVHVSDTARTPVVLRHRAALRSLRLGDLRAQSARAVSVGGGVLAGDLRAVRLEVSAPSTRARGRRLRARGPMGTVILRDALGLRRAPGSAVTGLVLIALATYAMAHAATPGVPSIIALAGLVTGYFGLGQWCEGLRLQGDNAGTPPLIGLEPVVEARAHLVVPGATYVVVALVVSGLTRAFGGGSTIGVAWAVAMVVILLGAQLLAAFRGLPPSSAFSAGRGIGTIALWYAVPMLVPAVVGTAATAMLLSTRFATYAIPLLVLASYATFLAGLRRVRRLTDAHRG